MSEPTRFRSRIVLMTTEDWRQFSKALKAAFPGAIYAMVPTEEQKCRPRSHPPRVLISDDFFRIQQAAARWDSQVSMVFEPNWRPIWRPREDERWRFWPPRHPSVDFRFLSGIRQLHDWPPEIMATWIDFRCSPAFHEHFLLAGRFYRLLGKFSSDRNLVEVEYPSGTVMETYTGKGSWRWVGHDARRWALLQPWHFLEVYPHKMQGLRPLETPPSRAKNIPANTGQEGSATTLAFRCHFVALGSDDIRQFSEGLAKAFPDAGYYMEPFRTHPFRDTPRILAGPELRRIWKYAWFRNTGVWMHFDPRWRPAWRHFWTSFGKTRSVHWRPRLPLIHFANIRGMHQPDGAPPSVRLGFIAVKYDSAVPEHCKIADRFMDVLSEVASDRDLTEIDLQSGKLVHNFLGKDRAWAWIGHHTRRWASANPDRYATLIPGKTGLRPMAPVADQNV